MKYRTHREEKEKNNKQTQTQKLQITDELHCNTNVPPILHRFHVMADYWSNFR